MAEQYIRINFETVTAGLDEANKRLIDLTDREADIKKAMRDSTNELNASRLAYDARGKTAEQVAEDMMKAAQKEATTQQKLRTELKGVRDQIVVNKKSIEELTNALNRSNNVFINTGKSTTTLRTQLRNVRDEMQNLMKSGQQNTAEFQNLAKEAANLQTAISRTGTNIKALSSESQFLTAAMGVGRGVTGTFNMATSAMAIFGGESEELQKAFFKTQAALQILNGAQMVSNTLMKSSVTNTILRNTLSKMFISNTAKETAGVAAQTGATGANIIAKNAETESVKANTVAWLANPMMWMAAIIVGVVAGIIALTKALNSQAKEQERINELEKLRLERLERTTSEIKKNTDDRIKELQREYDILQSLGASDDKLAEKRSEILQTQLEGAKQVKKEQQSNIDSLDENIKRQKELKKVLDEYNEAEKKGESYITVDIDVEGLIKGTTNKALLKNVKKVKEQIENELSNIEISITGAEAAIDAVDDINNKIEVSNNEQSKKDKERALRDAVTIAQIRVSEAQKGSEKELEARKTQIEAERKLALNAAELSAADKLKINSDANKKILDAEKQFTQYRLQEEKTRIETGIIMAKEGSIDEFSLRKELLNKQFEIEMEAASENLTQQQKLWEQYKKDVEQMNKDFNKRASENELNTQIALLNAQLPEVEKGGEVELNLRKQIAEKQAELQKKNIEATITDENLKNAKILELNAKLQEDIAKMDNVTVLNPVMAPEVPIDAFTKSIISNLSPPSCAM